MKSVQQLMTRLAAVEDFLYFGGEFAAVKPGQLPLTIAPPYYKGLERYVRRTVVAETDFRSTDARPNKRAQDYIKKINVGRVIEGSYLVTVHLPLESFTKSPLGRSVWQRILRCMNVLDEATARNSEAPLLALGDVGWSAPMCEAMGELIEQTDAIEIKAHVSPNSAYPSQPTVSALNAGFTVSPGKTVDILGRAISVLRGIPEEQRETVTGFLYSAEDRELAKQGDTRVVKIRWERPGHDPVTVSAELDPERYKQALEALRSRTPVSVSGVLTRRGVHLYLLPESQIALT
ncbi:MAG: hypothetical protein EON58_19690 [Alphaproteobacteria bacterium]|nr:MAG: hypothetical protein EON58_19690 [Alphaproteobacteria bacterium]